MEERLQRDIETLCEMLVNSRRTVFFGGAGMSTESGIPDFRGTGGLYTSEGAGNEYYLSRACLQREPEEFFRFFNEHMVFPNAKPNAGHYALARLEETGELSAVITQNIDGLHQAAGSRRVLELHGTLSRAYCSRCGRLHDSSCLVGESVPKCEKCGATVRPDVTLYGEALDGFVWREAENEIAEADLLIVGGSSLTVYPAASLVGNFEGKYLVIINYSPTAYDERANLVIRGSVGEVLGNLAALE